MAVLSLWTLAMGTGWPALSPAALAQAPPIPLDCRVAQGSWQACRMEVVDPGRHWFLQIGRRRFEFRHDGTGHMRMGVEGLWRDVTPVWSEDQSLCWDNVCVRGDIPLD